MKTITCDKCEKEIERDNLGGWPVTDKNYWSTTILLPPESGIIPEKHHFCYDCFRDFSNFVYQEYFGWGNLGWKKKGKKNGRL